MSASITRVTLLGTLWHWLAHGDKDTHRETLNGEWFVRCRRCGLRSPGIQVARARPAPAVAVVRVRVQPMTLGDALDAQESFEVYEAPGRPVSMHIH